MAEDVFQQTFLQVHLKCDQFEPGRKVRPWLYTVATNQAIDYRRRNRRHRMSSLNPAAYPSIVEDAHGVAELLGGLETGPADNAETAEQCRVLQAVDTLAEKSRQVVVLVYFQGLKYGEAAQVLSIPVGTVKSRMHAAMLTLSHTLLPAQLRTRSLLKRGSVRTWAIGPQRHATREVDESPLNVGVRKCTPSRWPTSTPSKPRDQSAFHGRIEQPDPRPFGGRPRDDGVEPLARFATAKALPRRISHLPLDLLGRVLLFGAVRGQRLQIALAIGGGLPGQGGLHQPLRDDIRDSGGWGPWNGCSRQPPGRNARRGPRRPGNRPYIRPAP